MKLKFDVKYKAQADPFIFEDDGKFYLFVTAGAGVEAYSAKSLTDIWHYEGVVTEFKSGHNFWAPSVIKIDDAYYMYVSFNDENIGQFMHVAKASSPLGPYKDEKMLYNFFSIDSHVVQTESGLFLWYAQNNYQGERIGTRVFVDKLLDPYTVANNPVEVIVPTFDEEKNVPCGGERPNWHTIEGPCYFKEGDYHYLMFSGGCYMNDTYHVGYAVAKTNETDLTKLEFIKHTDNGKFSPLLIKNDFEEGTGHHSVIKLGDNYYAIYHARDYGADKFDRTGRVCKLFVKDGIISVEVKENEL
ncbi:MAG: glycoside hydrolase family 43 protein [Clostridia bacterium]|nr:glycoside hydrolase family 43 protein [Clostridia bacterium]